MLFHKNTVNYGRILLKLRKLCFTDGIAGQELAASNKALEMSITQLTDKVGAMMREMQGLREAKTRSDNTTIQLRRQLTDQSFRVVS